jgi:hypothetical protein
MGKMEESGLEYSKLERIAEENPGRTLSSSTNSSSQLTQPCFLWVIVPVCSITDGLAAFQNSSPPLKDRLQPPLANIATMTLMASRTTDPVGGALTSRL